MDLMAIHATMRRKGYHYFTGTTNDRDEVLFLNFSTLTNGRGDTVDIEIKADDRHGVMWRKHQAPGSSFKQDMSEPELMQILENQI